MSNEQFRQYIIEKDDEKLKQSLSDPNKNGINFFWKDSDGYNSFLHIAVSVDNRFAIEQLLQIAPDLTKEKNDCGNTPLHLAALFDYDICATKIIERDRSLVLNGDSYSPLDIAIYYGSKKVLNILRTVFKPKEVTFNSACITPNNITIGFNPKVNSAAAAAALAPEQNDRDLDEILVTASHFSKLGQVTDSTLDDTTSSSQNPISTRASDKEFDFDDIFLSLPELSYRANISSVESITDVSMAVSRSVLPNSRPRFIPVSFRDGDSPLSAGSDDDDDDRICSRIKKPTNRSRF